MYEYMFLADTITPNMNLM